MTIESWAGYLSTFTAALEGMIVTDRHGTSLPPAEGFGRWVDLTRTLAERDATIYFAGNGASAAMASHMATDIMKNGHVRAWTFNDVALLTATANDVSYDEVFALPIQRAGRAGDMLVTISSSGNSPNIIRAIEAARAASLSVVTLSGKSADNRSRGLGDLNFYVPSPRYGWVESAHQVILHYWLDQYLNRYRDGAM